jgi:protein-tyrosine phosphatase
MNKVCAGLYIGDLDSARDKVLLDHHKITHVVSCIGTRYFQDIKYHVINLDDSPDANIYQYLYDAVEFVDEAIALQKNVFVHCYAGISRSASVVLAYIMAIKKYKLVDALSSLKSARPICQPNSGFMFQLKCFEWVLNLADEPAIYPPIFTGPTFNNHKFDFGLLDLIFDASLDDKYKQVITVSSYTIPAFRPGFKQHIVSQYAWAPTQFHKFDVLEYIESAPVSNNNKVLILADNLASMEAIYWNLLWRADYKWDMAKEYMDSNAPGLRGQPGIVRYEPPLEVVFTLDKSIIETRALAEMDEIDKRFATYKFRLSADYVMLTEIYTYFMKSLKDKKQELIDKYN